MTKRGMYSAAAAALAAGLAATLIGCATPKAEQTAAAAAASTTSATASVPAPLTPEVTAALTAVPATPAAAKPGTVALRRINESQYRQGIADIFGTDVEVVGRFEPDQRRDGLMAIGSADLSISSGGIEQYISMARSISDQVLDDKRRDKFLTCKPADEKTADDACAAQFLKIQGGKLFRRPLTDGELASRVQLANAAAGKVGSFRTGLKLALVSLLTSPEFLFRVEIAEQDPARPGQLRLNADTKAARLSYLFWNTTPDAELLASAASGDIHTEAGLKKQIDRLAASPRLEKGVRAFFADMMQFSRFDNTIKDGATFPKYSFAIAEAAQEQTLRTLVDLLLTRNGDYREIFTTPNTFINRPLAAVYDVPFLGQGDWTPYKYPDDAEQAGVVTQTAFLSMFSHPGRTSPTKRGVAVHEVFLCHVMPLPADNVDFTLINDSNNGTLKTVRQRLEVHRTNPQCAACHNLTDPLGLALERFDGIGQKRTIENGVVVDASSELEGVKFDGAKGLGQVLARNQAAPDCLVRNIYTYGVGRMPSEGFERTFLSAENKAFSHSGYRLKPLMISIASSPTFFGVVPQKAPANTDTPKPQIASAGENRPAGGQ